MSKCRKLARTRCPCKLGSHPFHPLLCFSVGWSFYPISPALSLLLRRGYPSLSGHVSISMAWNFLEILNGLPWVPAHGMHFLGGQEDVECLIDTRCWPCSADVERPLASSRCLESPLRYVLAGAPVVSVPLPPFHPPVCSEPGNKWPTSKNKFLSLPQNAHTVWNPAWVPGPHTFKSNWAYLLFPNPSNQGKIHSF